MTTPIVLTTLNATFAHCAFGLRYLLANLKELRPEARIVEFTIAQNTMDIVETLLSHEPSVVGFGVYIWNTRETYDVISALKRIAPHVIVVLGGPEVSHESETQPVCGLADFVIRGEGETLFYDLCQSWKNGKLPQEKFISGPLPDIKQISSPYPYYNDEDIHHRVIYVEASRGCPFKCEFCLSSLDKAVRGFHLETFLNDMDTLIQRGVRQFKFVDRTFNLATAVSSRILSFFLERISLGLFLHFEMIPDRLPHELKELIRRFPVGQLQFEIGIQTWSPTVAALVSRRQDYEKVRDNFLFLVNETNVHLHADLIVGLPGETLESFRSGFDAVAELRPHEIQVGILKRLKGTPIIRHDEAWGMVYQEHPPFQCLATRTMPFATLQKLVRFAKFWDLYANRGNFKTTLAFLRELSQTRTPPSFFDEFFDFSAFLTVRHPQRYAIALMNLVESAWLYLTTQRGVDKETARGILIQDYCGTVSRDIPPFLRGEQPAYPRAARNKMPPAHTPRQQQRHLPLSTDRGRW